MKRKTIRKHKDFFCPPNYIMVRSWFFIVKAKPVQIPGDPRYGLIAPKKDFKLAIKRNRAKRLIRDWLTYNEKFMIPDLDYIFILNSSILDSSRAKGRYEVKWALKQISNKFENNEK